MYIIKKTKFIIIYKKNIQKFVGKKVHIIDSAGAVARQTNRILSANNLLSKAKQKDLYYTTKDKKTFEKVVVKLMNRNITAQELTL